MKKGEKLLEFLIDQETKFLKIGYPPYRSGNDKKRLHFFHSILENISDEQMDEILNK